MNLIVPKYVNKVNSSIAKAYYKSLFKDIRQDFLCRTALFGFMYLLKDKKNKMNLESNADYSTDHAWSNTHFELFYGVFSIPHSKKRSKGGEDSYFVNNRLLAVADGVGGWKDYGIDPAKYARELCENIREEEEGIAFIDETTAKNILIKAANKTKAVGSSTLCIVLLDSINKKLNTAYVGDSVYMLLRYIDNKFCIIYKAQEQQHKFNMPYQLGKGGDDPENAVSNSHDVINNDILIIATDGLWDNLTDEYIEEQINKYSCNGEIQDINQFAKLIATDAEFLSKNKNYISPFAKKAKKENIYYVGGKPDDISVIVAQVVIKEDKAHLSESLVVRKKANYLPDKTGQYRSGI